MRSSTLVFAFTILMLVLGDGASASGYLQQGFGRFGRYHDDGLLTLNIHPDRLEVSGLTLRFASASVVPTVASIDTTRKELLLSSGAAGDASSVHYTLLYPGFEATFGTSAVLRLNRSSVIIEELSDGMLPVRRGLLLRASSGSMVPVAIGFPSGTDPLWSFVNLGSTSELVLTSDVPLGALRFFTPTGTRSVAATATASALDDLRWTASEWVGRGVPRLVDREVAVDFTAEQVRITEVFETQGGTVIAPVPPVLAFAMHNGYPAVVEQTFHRSGFPTRYGEFAWVDGSTVHYTLPIPPHEERGLIRPLGRDSEIALLNDMTSRLGASWAVNAVDLGYVGMTPAQMGWPLLNNANRTALANAWATYLPFAFRLPPYELADPRKTWIRETEPFSGLEYWYTYYITGGPGNAYKLDIEWGNMLPIYGLAKYAQFTGDWDFVAQRWDVVRQITDFTDYADDWAWMTNVNGDMGWSTGTGDPMTAGYVGHVAALRMARVLGDEEAAKHYAYRAARVAVPAVSRFWYTGWAREQGFIPSNNIVQGFWEKSTFTSTTQSQLTTDPWGPTNPLSGNGCQPEFLEALMRYAPEALHSYENAMLAGYPDLWNPNHVYPFSTTYGGNSVYVTFPHIYARNFLGQSPEELWAIANVAQSNRGTTSWIAPVPLAELLAQDTPIILTEWQPVRWVEGFMLSPAVVFLTFESTVARPWTLYARTLGDATVADVQRDGVSVPFAFADGWLSVTLDVDGVFDIQIRIEGAGCSSESIVDNESLTSFTTTGTWSTSANPPFVGSTSLFSWGGSPVSTATWGPSLDCPGTYDVYATWVAAPNRTTEATYRITHRDGTDDVVVNQQTLGNRWNLLGRHEFDAGRQGSVTLTNEGVPTDQIVSADAVRFVLIEPISASHWSIN